MSKRLLVISVAAVAIATVQVARGRETSPAAGQARPRLLSVHYGYVRPRGAPKPYFGLRLRTHFKNGQVVALDLEQLSPRVGVQALDGGCGLAASGNGKVGVWIVPGRLSPGRYRWRVTMYGASCGGSAKPATRTQNVGLRIP